MSRLAAFLLPGLMLLSPAPAAQPPGDVASETCATLEACVAKIRDRSAAANTGSGMDEQIVQFGDAAIEALVPMLADPDPEIRGRAGSLLASFRHIDPRHLPALVEAWRHGDTINNQGRGNGWMPVPIAATGTDEALRLLWADMLRDPEQGSNSQVFFALARFGERLRPLAHAQLRSCTVEWTKRCDGVISLFNELDGRFPRPVLPAMPQWAVDELVELVEQPTAARDAAVYALARLRHPAALPGLRRELDGISENDRDSDREWQTRMLIESIAAYGEAARGAGPAMAPYLDGRHDPDLRAEAALGLGQVGDRSSIAALMATAPDLRDDWLLAYNVAESLGRLRATQARSLLEGLQLQYWHRGVRNNAARALNMIAGGRFARPDVAEDGRAYPVPRDEQGNEYLYMGDLRYAGDDASRWCSLSGDERRIALSQDPVGEIVWPSRGGATLKPGGVDDARQVEIRREIPVRQVQGRVVTVLPVRSDRLVGFNGGEFGGGLYHLPRRGPARALLGEPVVAAWLMGGKLYVAAGLAHLVLDQGHLYVIDPRRLRVERTIRLPASPWRLAVSSHGAVIVETREGHVAIREDGRLIDPGRIGDCASDEDGE
jgi:HEAT repeat protein